MPAGFMDNLDLASIRSLTEISPESKDFILSVYKEKRARCRQDLSEQFLTCDKYAALMMKTTEGSPSADKLDKVWYMRNYLVGHSWCKECRLEVSNCMCHNVGVDSSDRVIYFD